MCTAGSRSPERVPITRPSSGVSPIDVSTDSPPRTAVADAPLPRCSTITLVSETSRPSAAACGRDTKRVRGAVEPVPADAVLLAPRARDGVRVARLRGSCGGRPCRRPSPAAGRGTACGPPRCPRGWRGCAAARAGRAPSTAATTSSSTSVGLDELLAAVHHPVPDRDHLDVAQLRAVVVERVDDRPQRVLERRRTPAPRCAPRRRPRAPAARRSPRSARRDPRRGDSPVSPSTRLYFSDDEPALTTSTYAVIAGPADIDWAWIAVIATVFTMSRTVAPRDRSFTGLRSPCRIGPTASAPAERCTAL